MPEHIELPFIPESFQRQAHAFGAKRKERTTQEKREFYNTSVQKIIHFQEVQSEKKRKSSGFFKPQLIFKIDTNAKESDESFRQELFKSNIEILSSSPDKSGYWVAFSEEEDLHSFMARLNDYAEERKKYDLLNSITGFDFIPKEEKIGNQLKQYEFNGDEKIYFDVELWQMPIKEQKEFIQGLKELINSEGSRVTDELVKKNFTLIRVYGTKSILSLLLDFNEVCFAELPPKPYLDFTYLNKSLEDFEVINRLTDQSSAVAVLDSGIVSNHPLFQGAIADEIPDVNGVISDDTGHGSQIAGLALYGDVKKCIDKGVFEQNVWIVSAKIMFDDGLGNPIYDPEKLLEHQLQDVVDEVTSNYPNCKIFNLSIGNQVNKVFELKKQFNLAVLLDELAKENGVIFTVSAGNIPQGDIPLEDYPKYFTKTIPDYKIIDPASAALAITVGSIAHEVAPYENNPGDLHFAPASFNHPSPFTCAGPGFKGMIKPELVEYGGNVITNRYNERVNNIAAKILSLNNNFTTGRLFSSEIGTSLSSPKIAHQLALLVNRYPEASSNMIKALLISSAKIPIERPSLFGNITKDSSDRDRQPLLNLYGYGLPSIEEALESTDEIALLIRENKIGLNKIHLYRIELPDSLFEVKGNRTFSVTLVYDPPVNKNRTDYLGCSMGFSLFRDTSIEVIREKYSSIQIDEVSTIDDIEDKIKLPNIKLLPGTKTRSKGVHQKGMIDFIRLQWDKDKPLVLSVVCQNKSIKDQGYLQDYAVIVKIEHVGNEALYSQIKLKNQARVQIRG
jgi:hypothetical protein